MIAKKHAAEVDEQVSDRRIRIGTQRQRVPDGVEAAETRDMEGDQLIEP